MTEDSEKEKKERMNVCLQSKPSNEECTCLIHAVKHQSLDILLALTKQHPGCTFAKQALFSKRDLPGLGLRIPELYDCQL